MIDKIEMEFFSEVKDYLDEENEKVKTLNAAKRQELIGTVKEYYQYLADNNISYGRLALEVVNNEGKYGLMANSHLKHQCIFDGIKAEKIPEIREQIIISLAYRDMIMRKSEGYNQNNDFARKIEDYHISVFISLATAYAWGGLAFRELVGTGSWLKLYEQGGSDLDAINLIFKNYKVSKEYSSTRLMDSIKHTWTSYHSGLGVVDPYVSEVPFSPSLDAISKEYLAKLYNISEDRIVEIDAPKPETPMVAYKHYKILPANEHNSQPTKRKIENQTKLAKLNESDLLPKELVTTINLFDNTSAVQKLDERGNVSYKFEIVHINDSSRSTNQSDDYELKHGPFIVRLKKDNKVISITQSPKQLSNNTEKMILSDAEKSIMLDRLKKTQDANGNDESNNSIHRKVLNLNAEQYNKIVKYIESGIKHNEVQILNKDVIGATSIESTSSDVNNSNTSSNSNQESYYAFSAVDSAELVQELYNIAGLQMYFTSLYSKKEFADLNSTEVTKAAQKYAIFSDNLSKSITLYGDSKADIAAKLNIDPKYIKLISQGGCATLCKKAASDESTGAKFTVKIDQALLQDIASNDSANIKHEDLVQGLQNVFLSNKIPPELPKDQLSHLDQNTNFSTLKSQISNVLSHSKSIFDKLLGKVDQQAAESNNSGHGIYTQDQVTKLFMDKYEALQKEFNNAHNKTSSGLLICNNTVTPKAQKIFQEKELALSTWISDELAKIPGTPQYLQTHQSSDKTPAVSSKTHHDKIVTSWNKEIDTARAKDFFNDKIDKSLNNPNKAIADLDKEFDIFLQGASSEFHVDLETL